MKQLVNLGGSTVELDFKRLQKGDRFGDWVYNGNSTQEGNPLWSEFYNLKTGETTIREYTPRSLVNTSDCDHDYRPVDTGGNVQCVKCEDGRRIITGYHKLENGKIITMIPAKRPHV